MKFHVEEFTPEINERCDGLHETFELLSSKSKSSKKREKATKELLTQLIKNMNQMGSHVFVAISEDDEIIGTGTIRLQQYIRDASLWVGHIEEIVTRSGYEKKGVGSAVMQALVDFGTQKGCYKLQLNCSESLAKYYERFGFKSVEVFMKYYPDR